MKFGIKCKVDSNSEIGKEPIQVTVNGMNFTFVPSEDGLLSELAVIVEVDNQDDFIAYIDTLAGLTIDYDPQIYNDLLDMVQYLEASLSFLLGVKKIYWDEPTLVYISESEEEARKFNVPEFTLHHRYPEHQRIRLNAGAFREIIQKKSKYEPYTINKLFDRDGMLEFASHRYIQAFYNFYFVLEDFYAQGKTNNHEVEKRFKSNQILREIIQDVLDNHIRGQGNHLQNIQNFLKEENKAFDVDGIIELIVQVRGNLHHYSGKSTKRKGTPLNQGDFESMAFLLMGISSFSIVRETFE